MSLIFIEFPDMQKARAFQEEVKKRYGLEGQVFATADEAHEHDMFPWVQNPPVVHIDRVEITDIAAIKQRFGLSDEEVKASDNGWYSAETQTAVNAEECVIKLVSGFGGVFVGT
jgi:hypothetical protein